RAEPRMLVGVNDGRSMPRGHGDWCDFGTEVAGACGGFSAMLARERVGVRLVAGDAVLPGEDLGGFSHQQAAKGTGKPVAKHPVDQREGAHAMAPSSFRRLDEIRHTTH